MGTLVFSSLNCFKFWKNIIRHQFLHRFLLFILALPCLQMINTCLTIGNDPTDLRIGVVNMDADCTNYTLNLNCEGDEPSAAFLSCHYLDLLPNKTLSLVCLNYSILTLKICMVMDLGVILS